MISILVPHICPACGAELVAGEDFLCLNCRLKLPLFRGDRDVLRLERLPRTAPIARVEPWLLYVHESDAAALIRNGKYNGRPQNFLHLARMMADHLRRTGAIDDVDLLVPVPMHWWRRLCRGYNQAQLIAMTLSRELGIPTANALKTSRRHRSQARSTGAMRARNIAGTMAISRSADVAGRHVAIIDDILTTGSTVSEAARVLAAAGAARISVFTLAAVNR